MLAELTQWRDRFPSPAEPVSWCRAAEEVGAIIGSLSVRLYAGLYLGLGEAINIRTSSQDGLYPERCFTKHMVRE